jgi:histidine triad (HIT) family protein
VRGVAECLFCRIVAKEIPSKAVYEDGEIYAFEDINPQAPVHVLLVPKTHLAHTLDVTEASAPLLGRLVLAANRIARERGVAESGFRLVVNTNREGGQVIFHLHLHLLAGRAMGWPPG